jgi:CBS domain-containing protein
MNPQATQVSGKSGADRVRDVMHPGVVFCVPQTPLRTVAQIVAQRRIHAVIVSDLDMPAWKYRWGVITDLDLIRAFGSDPLLTTADAVARSDPATIDASASLDQAARMMVEHATTHLIVVEGDPIRAVGVVSTLDLAAVMGESKG